MNTSPQQFNNDQLQQFVESLMKTAGVWDIDPTARDGLVLNLMKEVQQRIGLIAMEALDDKGMEAYAAFMTSNTTPTPEKIFEFFEHHIPNFQEVITQGLKTFADEYIDTGKHLAARAPAMS